MSCFRAFGQKQISVVILFFGYVKACPGVFQQPVGPFNGLFTVTVSYLASIHASSFNRGYKTRWWISGSPTCSFVIAVLRFYYARALLADTHCFLL
jgi:hypothetical protein